LLAAATEARTPMGEPTVGECAFGGCYVFARLFFAEGDRLERDWFAEYAFLGWGG
jgi:hypothetical protein